MLTLSPYSSVSASLAQWNYSMPAAVLTKRDFVRRFIAGEFGNRTPVWTSVPTDFDGELCFRGYEPGFRTVYNAPRTMPQPPGCYVSAMMPRDIEAKGLIQGEVMQSTRGLSLYCSSLRLPMKDALNIGGAQVYGLTASLLLRRNLCWNSYTWLQELLSLYPDHVVEFSAYAVNYGMLPNHNTLFWEVRNY